jgi:hypothetical protein
MRYALVYGFIAGAIVIGAIVIGLLLDLPNHATGSETLGYLIMLLAFSLIFVGVKRYRDLEGGGVIRFGRAFALGLAIAAVAGVVYVIGWEIYLAGSSRDFFAEYSAGIARDMAASGAPAAAIEARMAEMRGYAALYANPLFRIPLTFAEIFPVGLVVALVSALILRNPRALPAARAGA